MFITMKSNGITFVIPWDKFKLGTSIFIPTLKPENTLIAFRREATKEGVDFVYRIIVENNIQGLRFWKT